MARHLSHERVTAEDAVEDKAAEGGTLGKIADTADDAIDHVQGAKD